MFNNTRPIDYPVFKKAKFLGHKDVLVEQGDYIVDENGDLLEITCGNKKYSVSDKYYDREINTHYFRAKYLGNEGDCLGHANQIRFAEKEEIEKVKQWLANGVCYKVMQNGQLSFI